VPSACPLTTVFSSEVGRKIHPDTTKVTTATAFDAHGGNVGTKISAVDQEAAEVQEFLEKSHQFPKPVGWRAGAKLAVSSHVETKYALWMRKTGVRQLTLVINNDRVCPGAFGCVPAVRCILPRGSVMTVLSTTSGLRWELKGVAESCS
jgi:SCP1.201-like deaminase